MDNLLFGGNVESIRARLSASKVRVAKVGQCSRENVSRGRPDLKIGGRLNWWETGPLKTERRTLTKSSTRGMFDHNTSGM